MTDSIPILDNHYENTFQEINKMSSGSFGIVFKAIHKISEKEFAIKKIPFNEGEFSKRKFILGEVHFLKTLDPKYLVKCYNIWIEKIQMNDLENYKTYGISSISSHQKADTNYNILLYIQMELFNKTLKDIMNNEIKFEATEKLTRESIFVLNGLFTEMVECVNYLHKHNPPIIHRDLNPSNFLITNGSNGRFIKLADFGLTVFHVFESQSHTSSVDNHIYVDPEFMRFKKQYGDKADIYSLGIILRDLFSFDLNTSIFETEDISINKLLVKIREIMLKMIDNTPSSRPTCADILDMVKLENDLVLAPFNILYQSESFQEFFIRTKMKDTEQKLQNIKPETIKPENEIEVNKSIKEFNTDIIFNKIVKHYNDVLGEHYQHFCFGQYFDFISSPIKEATSDVFKKKFTEIEEIDFLKPYINKLSSLIDKTLDVIKNEIENKELVKNLYKDSISLIPVDFFEANNDTVFEAKRRKIRDGNNKLILLMVKYKDYLLKKIDNKYQTKMLENTLEKERENFYDNTFTKIKSISSGGYGVVDESEYKDFKSRFAVKQIPFNKEQKEKVSREIRVMFNLDDNYVVKCYDFWIEENYFTKNGYLYYENDGIKSGSSHGIFSPHNDLLLNIQMELCYKNLREIIEILNCEFGVKSFEKMILSHIYISSEIFKEILECLQYLHKQNPPIIHRDLKPDNVLIFYGFNGRFVKLGDFGLAVDHTSGSQSHTLGVGTKDYRAPEVTKTTHYGPLVDIYSVGMILTDLFNFELHRVLSESDERYIKIRNLISAMANAYAGFRPTCDRILEMKEIWDLDLRTIIRDEFQLTDVNIDLIENTTFKNIFLKSKYQCLNVNL